MKAHYTGLDRRGIARTGSTEIFDLMLWTEHKFKMGWQSLTVYMAENRDEPVALIGHGTDGKRSWWAAIV